jgi:hypothetical protein
MDLKKKKNLLLVTRKKTFNYKIAIIHIFGFFFFLNIYKFYLKKYKFNPKKKKNKGHIF